jgi:superfamily II DNA or RNA helicase
MERATKPNLTFVKEITHGRILTEGANRRGIRTEFVWGDKETEERQAANKRLIRGDIDCVVASIVYQQGIDLPELRSIVVGTGGKTAIGTLQRIGRGMRVTESKKTFEVFDIMDTGNKWLERHARKRKSDYEREGHTVTVTGAAETSTASSMDASP